MTEFQAKLITQLATILIVVGLGVYVHHHGYKQCEAEWQADTAKRDAVAAEQSAKARVAEAQQNAVTTSLKAKYEQTKTDRDSALERLRDYRLCEVSNMLGQDPVQVSTNGASAVSNEAQRPVGTDDTLALAASFTFANAVKDRDQCMALQSWVKAQGM